MVSRLAEIITEHELVPNANVRPVEGNTDMYKSLNAADAFI